MTVDSKNASQFLLQLVYAELFSFFLVYRWLLKILLSVSHFLQYLSTDSSILSLVS